MKKQLILGGSILLTSMALHMPSAMAYSSNTEAFADNGYVANQGATSASATFHSQTSNASVDGFNLHADSQVTNYDRREYEELQSLKTHRGDITKARASFSETFRITEAGEATLTFGWDGSLSVDAGSGLTAGYEFSASALGLSAGDSGENVSGTGETIVNSGGSIGLLFTEGQVGTTFDVDAYLITYISDQIIQCVQCNRVLASSQEGYSALADFSDTATFSFTGGIAAVPVPAAVWLLGSALMGLVGVRRRT